MKRPGLLHRLLFSVMGPPQLGEHRAPEGFEPDAGADRCPRCHAPWEVHERVESGSSAYRRCPAPPTA